jgi:hypothetical protein
MNCAFALSSSTDKSRHVATLAVVSFVGHAALTGLIAGSIGGSKRVGLG